jgi:predicted metal-binding protein
MIVAKIKRPSPIFVCAKCVRKADAGQAIRKAIKTEVKRLWRGTKPPRIVETKCLGICPKRAVAVASAATLREGKLLILQSSQDASEAIAMLVRER